MDNKNLAPDTSILVIKALGGTGAVAAICNVVPASVSCWKVKGIPPAREQFLRLRNPEVFRLLDDDNGRNEVVQAREIDRTQKENRDG